MMLKTVVKMIFYSDMMKMMISLMKITHPCLDDDDQENDDEDS